MHSITDSVLSSNIILSQTANKEVVCQVVLVGIVYLEVPDSVVIAFSTLKDEYFSSAIYFSRQVLANTAPRSSYL